MLESLKNKFNRFFNRKYTATGQDVDVIFASAVIQAIELSEKADLRAYIT